MASASKFFTFVDDLAHGVHDLDTHVLKIALTNDAINASDYSTLASITQVASADGYISGGVEASFSSDNQSSGVYTLVLADPATWTATTSSIGPFRFAVLYNDTPSSPADPLIAFWDYGASLTMAAGDTFAVDLTNTGVLTIT